MSSDNSVNAARMGYFYNRVGLKQGGVSQMSVKILRRFYLLKALPMSKYLYGCAVFLLIVGIACNLPVTATVAYAPTDSPASMERELGQVADNGRAGMAKYISQTGDVFLPQPPQLSDPGNQYENAAQSIAIATPTSQYPWDTTIILQGGATAQPGGASVVDIPASTPTVLTATPSMAPAQQMMVVQPSPTVQPTIVQPSFTPQAKITERSSLASSSGWFATLSRWFRWKKLPKPTQIVPTATSILPIVATLQPTEVLVPTSQPTNTAISPTGIPALPQPTQLPVTATPLPPTPTLPPATATLLPPTSTPLPPTVTPLPPTPTSVPPTATKPASTPASGNFYWSTGFETGNLSELEANSYGGFVNQGNGTYKLINSPAHSGKYAAALTIDTSKSSPTGAHAAYMFFWKELPGDAYYYSAWYYIPSGTVPAEWWNLWQWKSTYDGNSDNSQRIFSIGARPLNGGLGLYMVQRLPDGSKVNHNSTRNIPLDQWFHIEGYYRQAFDTTGQVIVWQDGVEVFNITNAQTVLNDLTVDWSVNNYSNQISPSPCTIYVDDIAVSSSRIGQ